MRQLYKKIESLLKLVPYEDICPGFGRYDFGIYNSDHVWLAHRVIPWDKRFVGNTAIVFEEGYLAIFYVEDPQRTDAEILAADLVHEMFHAYQMQCGENCYPDDFKLLAYPQDMENYRLKYGENQLLAAAYGETGERKAGLLAAFRAMKKQRAKSLGDYMEQELLAEHIEGRAEYAGCRALQAISHHKFEERIQRYLSALRTMDQAFFDIRRQAYFTGALYSLVSADCGERDPLQTELEKYLQDRAGRIEAFLNRKPVGREGKYQICGYDPMNMVKSGTKVLCTHFVVLQSEEEKLFLDGPVLLDQKVDGGRDVEKYWILPNSPV